MNNKKIDDQILEAFFKLSKVMKGHMSFESKAINLTMGQLHALTCIKNKKIMYMHDIASCFSISMPTASSLINKLIANKLVERIGDKDDRRLIKISLTSNGNKLLDVAVKHRNKEMSKVLSYLSETDKNDLLRILKKISDKEDVHEK